ncbi:helix-turn-helix domain-containing protein [Candidatus Pacearchaeota archaeon]|nr:helix-turn-helix domain-containing protein [Candidatus Pacearchaeota archaeon]
MWVAKIRMNGEKALIGSLCKKHNVAASGYPISTQWKGKYIYLNFVIFAFGSNDDINNFFKELSQHRRMSHFERRGHIIVGYLRESSKLSPMYHHHVFHVEPVVFEKNGEEMWTVASWERKELMSFSRLLEKRYGSKLLKIQQESISNLSVLTLHPELTIQQKKAVEVAIEQGYYDVPRKVELKELAHKIGISYSTYQTHLRKAEKKLLPFFFERAYRDIYR